MSEFDSVSLSAAGVGQSQEPVRAEVSAGTLLRQAREAAGLHIAALAVSLKVPVKRLEALEADRFELLLDAVFARALASSVCRTLKVDPTQILQRLPKSNPPKPARTSVAINTPFRAPGDGPGPTLWNYMSRPAALAGLVLLVGALVLMLLPAVTSVLHEIKSDSALKAGQVKSTPAAAGAIEGVNAAGATSSAAIDTASFPTGAAITAAMPASEENTSASSLSAAAQAVPAATSVSPAELLASSAGAASAAASSSSGIVVFRATGASWVEVTDAKGTVVLRRTLAAGEAAGASGALPLTAVVGRADVTEVKVRGKAFDMASYAKDNVARFEVK